MNPLFSYTNVHSRSSFHSILSSFFLSHNKKQQATSLLVDTPTALRNQKSVIMAAITPAHTTTQLLLSTSHNKQEASAAAPTFILPQQVIDLSIILQNNSKIPVASSGVGRLQPLNHMCSSIEEDKKRDPPAAQQPKRPLWTESHAYLRGARTNGDQLRILATESNMIRALKITRSLKPRKTYVARRKDEFVWGNPSTLRITSN
jgi:hypothetical protein